MKRRVTNYTLRSPKIHQAVCLALAPDLHNREYRDLLPILESVDGILVPGDMVDRYHQRWEKGAAFLRDAAKCAPTYVSRGNHERRLELEQDFWQEVGDSGITVLDGNVCRFNEDIVLGGFAAQPCDEVSITAVAALAGQEGFRLMLCHHPEYYPYYIRHTDIDLTVSGHAHGGQVQLFGRGLYAPGQGLLPRYTAGFYDDHRLLVSRGLSNLTWAPRLWNPCELVLLHLEPTK